MLLYCYYYSDRWRGGEEEKDNTKKRRLTVQWENGRTENRNEFKFKFLKNYSLLSFALNYSFFVGTFILKRENERINQQNLLINITQANENTYITETNRKKVNRRTHMKKNYIKTNLRQKRMHACKKTKKQYMHIFACSQSTRKIDHVTWLLNRHLFAVI